MVVCTCTQLHTHARLEQADPTRTITLRQAFVSDLKKRFRRLRGIIRTSIVDRDCFNLSPVVLVEMATTVTRQFNFPRTQDKVQAFMDWLKDQEEKGILETFERRQLGRGIEEHWTNKYVQTAYQKGLARARQEMRGAGYQVPGIEETGGIGVAFNQPMHLDRAGVLYTRVFNELKGITNAMDQQISRVLAQGLMDGENPRALAQLLNRTISGPSGDLGLTDRLGRFIPAERRAEILARTEVIRAHHQGTIQEYKNWGLEGVKVKAEWTTAGDSRVCPICASLEGRVYDIETIENMIPKHPQCRCIALPVDQSEVGAPAESVGVEGPPTGVVEEVVEELPYPGPTSEWITDVNQNRASAFSDVGELTDLPQQEIETQIQAVISKEIPEADVVVRIPSKGVLPKIIDEGRFKSQFETAKSGGLLDNSLRSDFEHHFFGYGNDLDPVKRPIYGVLTDDLDNVAAAQYGDAAVVLKSDIKNRTTWTSSDSLDINGSGHMPRVNPSPMLNPNVSSVEIPYSGVADMDDLLDKARVDKGNLFYTEAQIHQGVTFADIDHIVFDYQPPKGIVSKLKKKGIQWRLRYEDFE